MKRKQKHWSSEQEILDAIDECRKRSTSLKAEASILEASAKECIRRAAILDSLPESELATKEVEWGNSAGNRFRAQQNMGMAKKLEVSASNLIEKKCKKLGYALAAFRTQPMTPIIGDNVSVVNPP